MVLSAGTLARRLVALQHDLVHPGARALRLGHGSLDRFLEFVSQSHDLSVARALTPPLEVSLHPDHAAAGADVTAAIPPTSAAGGAAVVRRVVPQPPDDETLQDPKSSVDSDACLPEGRVKNQHAIKAYLASPLALGAGHAAVPEHR